MAKERSRIAPIHRDNDSPAMCEAISWLEQTGWSFYRPDRGTIMIDGYSSRCSESGLPALQALLNRRRS
jgi:hypothetical protein